MDKQLEDQKTFKVPLTIYGVPEEAIDDVMGTVEKMINDLGFSTFVSVAEEENE